LLFCSSARNLHRLCSVTRRHTACVPELCIYEGHLQIPAYLLQIVLLLCIDIFWP
jgi:hypothetical protein